MPTLPKPRTIGKAKIDRARVHVNGIEVTWIDESGEHSEVFQKVINCTGPESNYRKVKLPVLASLMKQGMLVNDPLGLGILCSEDGKIRLFDICRERVYISPVPYEKPYQAASCRGFLTPIGSLNNVRIVSNARRKALSVSSLSGTRLNS